MKGKYTLQVLKILSESAASFGDLFEAFLEAEYGSSLGHLEYKLGQVRRRRFKNAEEKRAYFDLQRRYHNTIGWLKKDSLILDRVDDKRRLIRATKKGLAKLKLLQARERHSPDYYVSEKSENLIIVAFDIPEQQRRHRDWLRVVLRHLGFKMLQKSMWAGRIKIPKEFIDDLLSKKIIRFVEILEITKRGSLRHISEDILSR